MPFATRKNLINALRVRYAQRETENEPNIISYIKFTLIIFSTLLVKKLKA